MANYENACSHTCDGNVKKKKQGIQNTGVKSNFHI